ncbi:MAG: thiol reductant ABC exporter subunit CydD [Lysobacterales bacterium 69-70]|nr:thiol reductant ABC exporter subunit CydD [Xanthomonadaceae bacterium]ODU34203.1 MAG: thiol reductant ABC exporter subunit CydD [Xanthomonadaceae bacterium SCN 69-320]ODV18538.1 MAG: thiol reductant ABC exporter subunit CydD [Xanthomonadaceae bacterium SCN 69-25]OJY96111.1 MAG: thiol reductant ABC exporter subunit CydD [Xanthomonadales bacterium 69-70]
MRGWTATAAAAGTAATLAYAVFAAALAAIVASWTGTGTVGRGAWIALVLALVARSALNALREAGGAQASLILRRQVRKDLLAALERLGPLRHRAGDDGALATVAVEQVDALDGYVARYLPQRHVAAFVPLLLWLLVLPRSWLAALLLLATAPLIPLFMLLVGRGAARASEAQAGALGRLGAQFLDLLRGLPTLRLLGATARGAARLAASAEDYRQRMLAVLRLAFLSAAVLELFASIGIALVALYLGLALLGRFDIGHYGVPLRLDTALFVLLLAPECYAPLRQLGVDYHARADALAAAAAIDAICAAAPPPRAAGTQTISQAAAPAIEFDAVTLRHADGRVALQDLNLRIAAGERVALRGASGAGKSTVLALLAGFVAPTAGTIRVDGVDLAALDRDAWWRRLAWLEQRPECFRRPLRENVLLGLADDDARLWDALAGAGLAELVRALPNGADSVPGEADGSLSGGQLQRLALARALAREADVWLLDEPLAHLDPATAAALRQRLAEASRGRTVLIATHSDEDLAWVDRVIELGGGRLRESAEQGP